MPAAKEMHLFAAIMRLPVVVETDLLLSANGSGEVAVGIEGDAGLFGEFFQPREEPGITVTREDHIRVILHSAVHSGHPRFHAASRRIGDT